MAKVAIPDSLLHKLGAEMKMDVHWIDLKLKSGRTLFKLVVRSGRYITGKGGAPNGESDLDFGTEDIAQVRRHAFLGPLWPFWD